MQDAAEQHLFVDITASDSHKFQAYVAKPAAAKAGLVVLQEIFGVNHHIRSVADDFARVGFFAVAPALFDRVERGVELAYDAQGRERGMPMARSLGIDKPLLDVAATIDWTRRQTGGTKVLVVGYCWGGTLAWLAATRLHPAAVVAYYGGGIPGLSPEPVTCPVMLHFGRLDPHIPAEAIDKIREHHPELPIYMYDAGHGFNCLERADYNAEASVMANQRTLEFFNRVLG